MTHQARSSAIGTHGRVLSSPTSQGFEKETPRSHGVGRGGSEGIPARPPISPPSDQVLLAAWGWGRWSSRQPKGDGTMAAIHSLTPILRGPPTARQSTRPVPGADEQTSSQPLSSPRAQE